MLGPKLLIFEPSRSAYITFSASGEPQKAA